MERLHILIDENLPPIYGCVQGGHAIAQWSIENPDDFQKWNNNYLIYLKTDIEMMKSKLERYSIPFTEFKEPDLQDATTALAILGNSNIFKKCKLMGKE